MGSSIAPGLCRSLRSHARSPCTVVEALSVDLRLGPERQLIVRFVVLGAVDRLRIPTADRPLDPERLWAHTCCELFVGAGEGRAYAEWNFSPTGQITRFEFDDDRSRRASSSPVLAHSSVDVEPGALRLEARVPLPAWLGAAGRLGPTAVIEDAAGELSYWAMRHPGERPDFHHRGGWALTWALHPSPILADAPLESP